MIVCSCNVLSDGQIRACLGPGPDCPRTAAQVYRCLGCSPKCGRCVRTIRQIMTDALGTDAHASCVTSCAPACPMSANGDAHHHHLHTETEVRVEA